MKLLIQYLLFLSNYPNTACILAFTFVCVWVRVHSCVWVGVHSCVCACAFVHACVCVLQDQDLLKAHADEGPELDVHLGMSDVMAHVDRLHCLEGQTEGAHTQEGTPLCVCLCRSFTQPLAVIWFAL